MASQTFFPTTWGGAAAGHGATAWSNSGNAGADDGAYAISTMAANGDTQGLIGQGGGSVPAGATINGIVVEVQRKSNGASSIVDLSLRLVDPGPKTEVGDNKADTVTNWGTADGTITYGSASDLWGTTWTAAQINAADFGVVFAADSILGSVRTASVDYIKITVHYTSPLYRANPRPRRRVAPARGADPAVYR